MRDKHRLDIPLHQQEYLALKGQRCPVCASSGIEGESVNIDAAEAQQVVRCLDCDSTWTDIYELAAFCNLGTPTEVT